MKKKIYIKQWLELKPYDRQVITDRYYLNISNDIKETITDDDFENSLMYLEEDEINVLACMLTSYFEDVISETNIWVSFLNLHNTHYGKVLPFYDLSDYYIGEINTQDVRFLIWYFLNTFQQEQFISPYNDYIDNISERIMVILEEAYEYAPENESLKSIYTLNPEETDFYEVRNYIDRILFKTYLFFSDTALELDRQEREIIKKNDDENLLMYLNENRDSFIHENHTCLMSLKGSEWAAEILGKDHAVSQDLPNMSKKILGYFFYKGQDKNDVLLEHIASGKKFNLTKKSFEHHSELKQVDDIFFMGIVRWRNEWWFSGIHFRTDFNADLILDEKDSMESRMMVDFLDHSESDTTGLINQQLEAFKDFNNGSQIAFLPSDEIEGFYEAYITYYNNSLKLTEKEKEESTQRARQEGFFGTEKETYDFSDVAESALVFFNPRSGAEIAFEVNCAFPLPNNPFFDIEKSEDHIMHLWMSESLSTELAMYCIDHCKSKLPFLNSDIGMKFLEDLDFLLRFWKRKNYHTKPSITYTGKREQ
jgi:hypothetical protein